MIWLMLLRGRSAWRYVAAASPCMKGEVVVPMFAWHVVIGWQRQEQP